MSVSGRTTVVGLIGYPVAHSLSPAMHNAAAADLGLDLVYVPFATPPGGLASAVRGLAALGVRGVNITIPHKQAALPYLDRVEPAALACGAVNTIVFERPAPTAVQAAGYNTDWSGFAADLVALGVPVQDRDCLVLGAGGSARAVVYALLRSGGRVHVLARRPQQAEQLLADLQPRIDIGRARPHDLRRLGDLRPSAPLIVNTTPLGMSPDVARSPWPDALPLPAGAFVYDLIYNPTTTRLMAQAQAQGRPAVNGMGMLLRQGALAFELWTGARPNLDVMRRALGPSIA